MLRTSHFLLVGITSLLLLASFQLPGQVSDTLKIQRFQNPANGYNHRIDSVQSRLRTTLKIDSKDSLLNTSFIPDSLRSRSLQRIDSARQRLAGKIDSLSHMHLPTEKLTQQLDSLNRLSPLNRVNKTADKITALEDKITKPIGNIESGITEKLSLMRKEGGSSTGLPPSMASPGIPQMPEVDLPRINGADVGVTGQADLGNVGDISKTSLPLINTERLDGVQDTQEKLGHLNDVTDNAQSYRGEVTDVVNGNLQNVDKVPQKLEQELIKQDQLQAVQKEIAKSPAPATLMPQGNPDAMKKQAAKTVYTAAIDHFAGKQQVLNEAIKKMDKLKAKYPHLTTIKENIPRKMRNAMHGKSFKERLVPGIEFQIQKTDRTLVDYNPNIGYRFTGRFTGGLGWNERFSVQKFRPSYQQRIYGPRVFADFKVWKGFSARLEIEKMYTFIPRVVNMTTSDPEYNAWVWSAFVGIKKEYQFIRRVKGNMQVLYNLYDDHNNSPYIQRASVRFGFTFPMKKKKIQEIPATQYTSQGH